MIRQISLPLAEQTAAELRAGEEVELTGAVLTGRDQACARLFQMMQARIELPVILVEQMIYFVGPSPARPGEVIGSAGPTTSGRMNPYLPALLSAGLRGFIGKGYLSDAVKEALLARRGVYFGAIGGTGALLSDCIASAQVIAFPELLSEAMHLLRLSHFPSVVLFDSHGGDLYAEASPLVRRSDISGANELIPASQEGSGSEPVFLEPFSEVPPEKPRKPL